jgi:hypothetical protein
MRTILFGLALAAFAVPASAAPDQQQPASQVVALNTIGGGAGETAAPAQAQPTPEKKVCKQLPSSYSRMTERVCLTKQEWKQVEAEMRN